MSGYLGDLSKTQQEILDQFRDAVSDIRKPNHTDSFLLKWLRAREFDLAKAEQMFRKSMKWREEHDMDRIVEDYKAPDSVAKFFPGGILDCSPGGHPVWLVPIGYLDIKGYLALAPFSDLYRHGIYLLELQEHLKRVKSQSTGNEVETGYIVLDFEHFSLRQVYSFQVMSAMSRLAMAFEDNYPEALEKAMLVNTPSFFHLAWRILRPLLSPRTASRVFIPNRDDAHETLLKYLDPAGLPKHWGGSLLGADGDPRCPEKILPGGELPGLTPIAERLCSGKVAVKKIIGSRSLLELPMNVAVEGSKLAWAFETVRGDLAFGLRYVPPCGNPGDAEQLLHLHRVISCAQITEKGSFRCSRRGTYVLQFDNSFSWMTSKTLFYTVHVKTPADEGMLQ